MKAEVASGDDYVVYGGTWKGLKGGGEGGISAREGERGEGELGKRRARLEREEEEARGELETYRENTLYG